MFARAVEPLISNKVEVISTSTDFRNIFFIENDIFGDIIKLNITLFYINAITP